MKKKFVLMLTAALLAVTPISTSMVWAEETAVDANTAAEPDVITTDTGFNSLDFYRRYPNLAIRHSFAFFFPMAYSIN